jgi:molecular chaperone DnaK
LGEFILTGLRRATKGAVEIEVAFEINTDGIVSVNAKDLETGQAQSIQVTATSGLTQDEIKNMMADAQDYMVERRSDEVFEGAKQEAETLIAEVEALFPEVERIVGGADFGRDALEKARGALDRCKRAIASHNVEAIREQVEQLGRTQRMFRGVVTRAD